MNPCNPRIVVDPNTVMNANGVINHKDIRERWYIGGSPKSVITDDLSKSNTALDMSRFKKRFQSLTDSVRIIDNNTEGKIYVHM